MSDNKQESFGYVQAKSDKGVSFAIGYPSGEIPGAMVNTESAGRPFSRDVHWKVNGEMHDTLPDGEKMMTGINSYALGNSASPFYDWFLEVHVDKTYNFWFTDEEGDTYNLNTWVQGNHIVRFNSKKPTIVHVKGE